MNCRKYHAQKGQVALIVVLAMIVLGTVALSVVSRSITNITLTGQEESKIRSFSAAEAGIEDLLRQGLAGKLALPQGQATVGSGDQQISYDYKVTTVGSGGGGFERETPLREQETIQIGLTGVASRPNALTIYWVNQNVAAETDNKASLILSVFNADNTVFRVAVNAQGVSRDNGFAGGSAGGAFGSKTYHSKYTLALAANASSVRIRPLYNQASLAVKPENGELPVQAYKAKVSSRQEESFASIEVVEGVQIPVEIFDHVLWSGGSLIHN